MQVALTKSGRRELPSRFLSTGGGNEVESPPPEWIVYIGNVDEAV